MRKRHVSINQLINKYFVRCKLKCGYLLLPRVIINKYYKICSFVYHPSYFLCFDFCFWLQYLVKLTSDYLLNFDN